jgi:hypothetical protein
VQDPTSSIFLSRLQEQQSSHLLGPGGNGRQPYRPTQQHPAPREGVLQASYYLAEHNVPAFGGLGPGLGGSPLNGRASPGIARGGGGGGGGGSKHPLKSRSRQAPVLQEEQAEDEREAEGWNDVASDDRQTQGSKTDNNDDDDDDDDNGEDQDLLRLLGAIGSTRLGR